MSKRRRNAPMSRRWKVALIAYCLFAGVAFLVNAIDAVTVHSLSNAGWAAACPVSLIITIIAWGAWGRQDAENQRLRKQRAQLDQWLTDNGVTVPEDDEE